MTSTFSIRIGGSAAKELSRLSKPDRDHGRRRISELAESPLQGRFQKANSVAFAGFGSASTGSSAKSGTTCFSSSHPDRPSPLRRPQTPMASDRELAEFPPKRPFRRSGQPPARMAGQLSVHTSRHASYRSSPEVFKAHVPFPAGKGMCLRNQAKQHRNANASVNLALLNGSVHPDNSGKSPPPTRPSTPRSCPLERAVRRPARCPRGALPHSRRSG